MRSSKERYLTINPFVFLLHYSNIITKKNNGKLHKQMHDWQFSVWQMQFLCVCSVGTFP